MKSVNSVVESTATRSSQRHERRSHHANRPSLLLHLLQFHVFLSCFIFCCFDVSCLKVCAMCSEEDTEIMYENKDAEYVVCFDPLDGSSNIDANVSIGSIFAIFKR